GRPTSPAAARPHRHALPRVARAGLRSTGTAGLTPRRQRAPLLEGLLLSRLTRGERPRSIARPPLNELVTPLVCVQTLAAATRLREADTFKQFFRTEGSASSAPLLPVRLRYAQEAW